MRILRFLLLLLISFNLSFGLIIIANNFQIFSYARFAELALYLTPVAFLGVLLISRRFPPPGDWTRSKNFKRETIWIAVLALAMILPLTPVYDGLGRYLVTLAVVVPALFIWGTLIALSIFFSETESAKQIQDYQAEHEPPQAHSSRMNTLEKILMAFFLLIGAAGMGIFLYMGLFVRMYGDDWCYHTQALVQGVFPAAIDFYQTWSGRLFSNFLVFAGAGSRWTPLIQMALVVISIFACCYWAFSVSTFTGRKDRLRRRFRISWSLACAFLIPFVTFSITPDPYKSLYWIVSSLIVLPFMILMPVYLALMKPFLLLNGSEELNPKFRMSTAGYTLVGFLLSFMISTIHEVATVPVIILNSFLFGLVWFTESRRVDRGGRQSIILGAALAGSLLGLLVVFFSPGNALRAVSQGYPQPTEIPELLKLNSEYFLRYLERISFGVIPPSVNGAWDLAGVGWFALIPVYVVGYLGARPGRIAWNPPVVLALSLAMAWASFLPGTYAARVEIPLRSELIPTFILVFGSLIAGILSPRLSSGYLPAVVLSIALLLSAFYFRDLIKKQTALVGPIVNYASEWDARHARLLSSDKPIYLLQPPWDFQEQGENCINIYYNYRRFGVYDNDFR